MDFENMPIVENAMMQVTEVMCHVSTCQRPECKATGTCHAAKVRDEGCAPCYGEHDAGPWSASADGREISSDDFTHDVLLRVSGDFADDAQRKRYADNLVAKLNTPNVAIKAPVLRSA